MNNRPYFYNGIAELETLFEKNRSDAGFLNQLIEELSLRKTARAQILKQYALSEIEQLNNTGDPIRQIGENEVLPAVIVSETEEVKPSSVQIDVKGLKKISLPPLPPISNKPEEIFASWIAMEVLSPPAFNKPEDLTSGERSRIASLEGWHLPWENGGERSRPNNRLYYQIILGSIDLPAAVSELLEVFTDAREERPQARGESVLATILVDKNGCPVESETVAISSFGWGVPIALSGNLRQLGKWTEAEEILVAELTNQIIKRDKEDKILPLGKKDIEGAYNWLCLTLGIESRFLKAPTFAVRSYQYFKFPDPPEAIILNSFYLTDLAKAYQLVTSGKATPNLKRYLGITKPTFRRNLMEDPSALAIALEPKKYPLGSWPGNGRHPLVTLQQCAVNLAISETKKEGILAVNGPPGTGKTTLLRDIIAAIITDRAEVLCSYRDPEDAFSSTGLQIRRGGAFLQIYKLDEKLRGQEIIVASSNNKAVENVSAEFPALEAIANDADHLRYFKTASDALLKRETWGVIAAVLGNAKNRYEFRQTFWWDEDFGLQKYLQEASGNPQTISENGLSGLIKRKPKIILQEKPPEDHREALRRWELAREKFKKISSEATAVLHSLQRAQDLQVSLPEIEATLLLIEAKFVEDQSALVSAQESLRESEAILNKELAVVKNLEERRDVSLATRPGLFSRLFGGEAYRTWKVLHRAIEGQLTQAQTQLSELNENANTKKQLLEEISSELEKLEVHKAVESGRLSNERIEYQYLQEKFKGRFINPEFFNLSHEKRQTSSPWLDEDTARLRNEVFVAAIALQKAFIDAAARPLRHNLNILMESFGTRSLGNPDKDALIPNLWSSFFLVVPTVSTTFASISRMFGRIQPEDFGWLLIDEAGQALPQAAVGGLMRTRRAVVVGDPIQIEPVVMLPEKLTEAICAQFGIDPLVYNAPAASAQTLADAATTYYGAFETKHGTREVGVPLLVHRRCDEPMFSISNAIAYENLMVQAKKPGVSPIREILGPSRWIDVQGRGQNKWCAEEGEAVVNLVRAIRMAGGQPNFYIVTPFVIVQDRLRDLLRSSGVLDTWVEDPFKWVFERIGTVHTVQGREAEAVIFVLGAPDSAQRGARGWAGGRPNLLNVAVTRSKEVLYVIGNRELWRNAGHFEAMHKLIGEKH